MVKIATTLFSYPWQGLYITSSCISSFFFFFLNSCKLLFLFHIKKIHFWYVVYFRPSSFSQVNRSFIHDDLSSIPGVGKIPWRRAWQPTPVFSPGESPWTEEPGELQSMGSDKTEQLGTHYVRCTT